MEVGRRQSEKQMAPKSSVGGPIIGESPRMSVVSHVSLIQQQQMDKVPQVPSNYSPSDVGGQQINGAAMANRPSNYNGSELSAKKMNNNVFDTDVGELLKTPLNPRWKEFAVEKPMKNADYVSYEVIGYDMKGDFKVRKRYSDFFMLRKVLRERWPGFYIPAIPPKKALGNMELDFIRNRLTHLDNFIK